MGDVPVSKGIPAGGQFLTTPPTLTDRQHLTLQLDENGNLKCIFLTTDELGNVVSVSTESISGLTAQIVKDPVALKYLQKLVEYGEAQKKYNLDGLKAGIQAPDDLFSPLKGQNSNALNMVFDALKGNWNRAKSGIGTPGVPSVNKEGTLPTYSCAILDTTAAASATDIFTIRGSASKTIRVTRIALSGIATANTTATVQLIKYSVAFSGGTPVAGVAVPHDSKDVAATAAIATYTANPTVGTTVVGKLRARSKTFTTAATSTVTEDAWEMDFTERNEKGIVLRGLNEYIALNLVGVTVTGLIFNVDATWVEETI